MSELLTFDCPHCRRPVQAHPIYSDRDVLCPICHRSFVIVRKPDPCEGRKASSPETGQSFVLMMAGCATIPLFVLSCLGLFYVAFAMVVLGLATGLFTLSAFELRLQARNVTFYFLLTCLIVESVLGCWAMWMGW